MWPFVLILLVIFSLLAMPSYASSKSDTPDVVAHNVLEKAAENGDAKAQAFLGLDYDLGRGVTRNYAKAAKWYRKAAEQGNLDAQYMLGRFYGSGVGVTQNYEEAYFWFVLSSISGKEETEAWRDKVSRFLTPEQISKIQKRALDWNRTPASASKP